MFPRPPTYTLTGTLFPDTTPYRSESVAAWSDGGDGSSNPAIGPGGRSDFAGPEDDPLARLGETPSLRDHLAAQLAVEIVDPIDRMIGHHLIDSLDERSEEHPSELQSLMRISYAVFCLKKKNT